jgi:hypothetical protein
MRPVSREEIVDYQTWEEKRPQERAAIMRLKDQRRVHVGDALTFLFETRDTVRYQVQEMMRTERIVRERDIRHELDTYNELLGDEGELGCTLLIEIDDRATRDVKLREWLALPEHVYVALEDGTRVRARFDERQRGADRVSSVQYLRFDVGGRTPVAAGIDLPGIASETRLTDEQRAALATDLRA